MNLLGTWSYRPLELARLLGFAALYALLAAFVLRLFSANGVVSIIWPPSGLALAALLLGGRKYAPGVWLGAWAGNLLAGSSLFVSTVIAVGNTLEALTALWLLTAWPSRSSFDLTLHSLRDLLRLIFLGAFSASIVSALIGSTVLLGSGLIGSDAYAANLAYWWMGDALGIVLVTPLLLIWRQAPDWRARARLGEAAWLLGLSLLVGQILFFDWFNPLFGPLARGYWMFLLLTWIAIRLGAHGVLALLAMVAVQALWGACLHTGFFAGTAIHLELTAYWGYMLALSIVGMVLAIYIEGLKRSEESLTKLSWVVEQSFNTIIITNTQAEIEFVNEAFTRTTGYTLDEVRGQNPRLLASKQTPRETFTALWQALMAGQSWRGEVINQNKDGKIFIAAQVVSPIRQPNGKISHYVSIMEDITDKKRRAAELERHRNHLEERVAERTAQLSRVEMQLRLILESTADGLFGCDDDGCFTFVNPAACRLLGTTAEQLIGRPVHSAIHHHRPDGTPFSITECHQHAALFAGQAMRIEDDVFWRADGQALPVSVAGQPMLCEGKFIGTVVSFTDIGERKRGEAARDAALAEAKRLTRVKSEFLANMSHEIRTPLNAVLGLARIGMRENQGRKSGETCSHIFAAGEHLLGIINDILDFSKIEAGKLNLESRAFTLTGLTDQLLSFVIDSASAKGLPIHVMLADELPDWVLGDAQRLRQVLVNLMSNAIKFTAQGEIRLVVKRAANLTSFSISDTGIGMNQEQIQRLFTTFEQADNSTTRLYGGTGLGLAISRQLARLMGGDIEVSSVLGTGSVFTLHLPLPATAAPERINGPIGSQGPRLTGVRVLAAEDIEVNQLVLADLLEQEGAHTVFAKNGRETLDRVIKDGSQAFDVVLMDVQMPVMDGLEATRRLKEIAPDLPVIGLTAQAQAEERERCRVAGMLEHVTKPIDGDALVAAILRHVVQKPLPSLALSNALSITSAPPPSAAEAASALIDWAALSKQFDARHAFIDKLLETARQSQRETPEKLRAAARHGDRETLAFLAHSLKGVCGNIHAKGAYALARQTEDSARSGDNDAPLLAEALAAQLEMLLAVLEARK